MKTILGMLLLIAAIGITTGTDYSEIEMIGEDVLEDSASQLPGPKGLGLRTAERD